MPELPEVETTCRGIEPHVAKQTVFDVTIRQRSLRWPIPKGLAKQLKGHVVRAVDRRGKYILMQFDEGVLIVHLGMSGRLYLVEHDEPVGKHDHVDIVLKSKKILRFTDPRRFGCVLWSPHPVAEHKLLVKLGPEPLTDEFTADYLYSYSRKRKVAIKTFVMNSHVVVGVGNIYANEALFIAGIRPTKPAGKVTRASYEKLVPAIKRVLAKAIEEGGTTLRDFLGGDGKPGYFQQQLDVYGRAGEPCVNCEAPLKEVRQSNRSTVYCSQCQR